MNTITRYLINIRCSRVVNYTTTPSQAFRHKIHTLLGFHLYVTHPVQWVRLQESGLHPNAQLPDFYHWCFSRPEKHVPNRSRWAMHCLRHLSQQEISSNTFYCQRKERLWESGILLIRAYEVYNKIQFVEDAGRWKTSPLTEWVLWAHFTLCQASQSVWSIKCIF